MQIKDLMTTHVFTCSPEDSLERAAQLMWEGDVGMIPALDAQGNIAGIITDRDICMAAYTQGCTLRDRSVGSTMSRHVESCAPTDRVSVAEERMRKSQVRRLPVIDGGRLVGIVSLNDLAISAARSKSGKGDQLSPEDVAVTLAGISRHRQPAALAAQ